MPKTQNEYWLYLEDLRRSGATNMFGAIPYLMSRFSLSRKSAGDILIDWMNNYKASDYDDCEENRYGTE